MDVPLIATTHVDLQKCIRKSIFREDLYYRTLGIVIHPPTLRSGEYGPVSRLIILKGSNERLFELRAARTAILSPVVMRPPFYASRPLTRKTRVLRFLSAR